MHMHICCDYLGINFIVIAGGREVELELLILRRPEDGWKWVELDAKMG